jgi:hypothetical protein
VAVDALAALLFLNPFDDGTISFLPLCCKNESRAARAERITGEFKQQQQQQQQQQSSSSMRRKRSAFSHARTRTVRKRQV